MEWPFPLRRVRPDELFGIWKDLRGGRFRIDVGPTPYASPWIAETERFLLYLDAWEVQPVAWDKAAQEAVKLDVFAWALWRWGLWHAGSCWYASRLERWRDEQEVRLERVRNAWMAPLGPEPRPVEGPHQ